MAAADHATAAIKVAKIYTRRDWVSGAVEIFVADSDPEYEFEETMNKARAVLTAIDLAREGMD